MIQNGIIDPWIGVSACTLGIFFGDYLLFLTGREINGFLKKRKSFQFLYESDTFHNLSERLTTNFAKTIFLSRFMPGTRLPIYTFAGMISKSSLPFLGYTGIASLIWTPAMILFAYGYGETFKLFYETNQFYFFLFLCIGSLFFFYQIILLCLIQEKRQTFLLNLKKIPKLEFWPMWLFYLPLVPYVCYLMIRYGSIRNISISNPGIPFSGIANESKSEILSKLPEDWVAKFFLLKGNSGELSKAQIQQAILQCGNVFPFILKPDVGERGAGVCLVYDEDMIFKILSESKVDYILQEYHPGPLEAGIFYYRIPGENKGKIYSITDKIFPYLTGDGKRTLKELILDHPRFVFQKEVFLKRLGNDSNLIPSFNEKVKLGFAGNHIQGCMFCDGKYLLSDSLEETIDQISKKFSGFYFGRYDVRYANAEDFKTGKNFKIIELNGAMSESTNLYDPNFSIFQSYRILFKQWKFLFIISKKNRNLGILPPTWKSFFHMMKDYKQYKQKIDPIAK